MIRFVTNILEPISYFIFFVFFLFYSRIEKSNKIWAFLCYYFISSFLLFIATKRVFAETNNISLYNLHLLLTSLVYCFYFYNLLVIKRKRLFFYSMATLSIGYYIVKNILLKDAAVFDSFGFSLISAFVILCLFFYFWQEINQFSESEIFISFDFWYSSSLFLYHLGAFIIFLSYYFLTQRIIDDYSAKHRDTLTLLWGIHNILLFLSSLTTISGTLWITYRRK